MLTLQQIKQKIEEGLPGSQAEILDPRKDGVHLKAVVTYDGFQNKSLIEQHQMVYDTLKEELKEELHALAIETHSTKEQNNQQGERELKEDDNPTFNKIREMINSSKVFLFMKGTPDFPQCGFSMQVIQILNQLNIEYQSFDVLSDDEVRQGIKDFSNWPTIPQLFINGKFIGGCDITIELYQKGVLQRLVEA